MENNSLVKNKRVLSVLEGIFLILLAIAIPINMGYIMRSLVAALIFLFGINIYLFAVVLFIEGTFLILKGKLLLPNKKWKYLPLIVGFVFLGVLVSAIEMHLFNIVESNDIIRDFFMFYNKFPGGYYSPSYINLFEVPFGGGMIAYLLALPFILLMGKVATITTCSVIVFICLFIFLFPVIKVLVSNIKSSISQKEKKPRKTKQERLQEKYKNSFVEESNIYLHADEVGNDEVTPIMKSNEISRVSFNNRNDSLLPDDINTNRPLTETGTLEKAKLDLFMHEDKLPHPFEAETVYPQVEEEVENTSIEEYEKSLEQEESSLPQEEIETVETPVEPPLEDRPTIEEVKPQDVIIEKKEPEIKIEEPIIETKITKEEVVKEKRQKDILPPPVKEEPKVDINVNIKHANWIPPSTDALMTYQTDTQVQANIEGAKEKMARINQAFADFNIKAEVVNFVVGPSTTRLLVDYPSTGYIKAVAQRIDDISRRLDGCPLRFAETVQGTPYSGFEVPNIVSSTVSFKEVFEALPPSDKHPTAVAFGKDIAGKVIYADLAEFPHMLISGSTGSGKSVFVNSLIITLLARTSPDDLKVVLVDPKRVEMSKYRDEPHLFCPVINDSNEAKVMLYKMVDYMNERYQKFEEADYATNIKEYNAWAKANKKKTMPYIVIFLDEFADLAYSCKEVSVPLVSICQKSRACGIHVVVCTQRPSSDVITGTIKANLNTRVALTASSAVDSTVVLDEGGAEDLLGNGDMLVKSPLVSRTGLMRIQGCYIQGKEMVYILNYLKANYKPEYEESFLDLSEVEPEPPTTAMFNSPLDGEDSDEVKYQWIKDWASTQDYVSMSKIQRECSVGFNRAGKIVKRLQEEGVLSFDSEGSNKGYKVINAQSRFNDAPDIDSSEITNKGGNYGK